MNLGELVLAYFVIGAVMFGGGAIDFDEAGITKLMISNEGGEVGIADSFIAQWKSITTSPTIFESIGGAMIMIWDLLVLFLGGAFWPVLVMASNDSPTTVTVLLGGSFAMAFVVAGLRFIRSSL